MPTNFRSLQERLRERLLAHIAAGELTGLELARRTGFQQAHISNFLNRKRGLSLEAMDTILKVTRIHLNDLLPQEKITRCNLARPNGGAAEIMRIPFASGANCAATQVPNSNAKDTLVIASHLVQNLRPAMQTPRPHWDRFIAWRVRPEDVDAMAPRLESGAVAVIDRHCNSPAAARRKSMYLVRCHGVHIRYVERVGEQVALRPQNPDLPLLWADTSAIVGRVCLVQTAV